MDVREAMGVLSDYITKAQCKGIYSIDELTEIQNAEQVLYVFFDAMGV